MTNDQGLGAPRTLFRLDDDLDEDDEDDDEDEKDKEPGDDDGDDEDEDEDDEDEDEEETWQVAAPPSTLLKAARGLTSGCELPRLTRIS